MSRLVLALVGLVQPLVDKGPVLRLSCRKQVRRGVLLEPICKGVCLVFLDGLEPAGNLGPCQCAQTEGDDTCKADGPENPAVHKAVYQYVEADSYDGHNFCKEGYVVVGRRTRYGPKHKAQGDATAHVAFHGVMVKEGCGCKDGHQNPSYKEKSQGNSDGRQYAPPVRKPVVGKAEEACKQ